MIRRYREILNILLNTDGCITGTELAKRCNVSLRTIRIDIKEINNELREYNIKIDSVVKKGYYLTDASKDVLKETNVIRLVLDNKYIAEMPSEPMERQMYIILKLTMEEGYIDIETLSDKLYISIYTLNNDIIAAKKWLKRNLNLNLNYSIAKGIRLNCSEKDKRNIISWIIAKKSNASTITKYWNYLFGNKEIVNYTDKLFPIVNKETKKYGYILSGHSSQLFCNEIVVAASRCEIGFNLDENDKINKEELLPVIIDIRQRIESELMIKLSEIEWLTLQQYFKSRQFIHGTIIENIVTKEASDIVNAFIKNVYEKFKIDLMASSELKENLLLYVAPMINRLKFRYSIANMIDENIIEGYPMEFEIASEMVSLIKKEFGVNIPLIELAYITLHLVSTKEICSKKLNAIIVCDFDESIITFIKNKIFKHLSEKIRFCGSYTYQEFIFGLIKNLEEIDLIITTATLADKTDIPLINISPTMGEKDIDNLYEYIGQLKIFNNT